MLCRRDLATDSDSGRVFEVTQDGQKVWEFWNPDLSDDGKNRSTIYRMMRLEPKRAAALALPEAVKNTLLAYR